MKLLRIDQVAELTGLSKKTSYHYMSTGQFSQCIKVGLRVSRWLGSDVAARVEAKRREKLELNIYNLETSYQVINEIFN
ncbi:helix-turn-helix transcriptional regulator [Vibrio lentus]|uniref:AlpA family phage regulatory protein n=1 Tax=Vibrio lentus TaxID=136468 RepID=A0A855IQF9_9VIBR|nr:hypothetical protein BCT50_05930 [Vibrio lentus]